MNTHNLQNELDNLQTNVIGFFKPFKSTHVEMVLSNHDGVLKTVTIGRLGGLHTLNIDKSNGVLVIFSEVSEHKNLLDLKKNPFLMRDMIEQLESNKTFEKVAS